LQRINDGPGLNVGLAVFAGVLSRLRLLRGGWCDGNDAGDRGRRQQASCYEPARLHRSSVSAFSGPDREFARNYT
jgi:hypothetical protein